MVSQSPSAALSRRNRGCVRYHCHCQKCGPCNTCQPGTTVSSYLLTVSNIGNVPCEIDDGFFPVAVFQGCDNLNASYLIVRECEQPDQPPGQGAECQWDSQFTDPYSMGENSFDPDNNCVTPVWQPSPRVGPWSLSAPTEFRGWEITYGDLANPYGRWRTLQEPIPVNCNQTLSGFAWEEFNILDSPCKNALMNALFLVEPQ